MPNFRIIWQKILEQGRILLDESGPAAEGRVSRWGRFVHFWVLVCVSFNRNRCLVRAAALAYATLLALIPMLAVVMSITGSLLKSQGEEQINDFIGKMVATLTPPAPAPTSEFDESQSAEEDQAVAPNGDSQALPGSQPGSPTNSASQLTPSTAEQGPTNSARASPQDSGPRPVQDPQLMDARKAAAQHINRFIQNTRTSALGVTGSLVLIFVAISMLSRIETTFNDIWGVERGRSWFMRIVLYWWVLTLVPILLVVALGLASGPQFRATQLLVANLPVVGNFIVNLGFQLLPIVVLCLTFSVFYLMMPNTKVHWRAAVIGGLVGGLLFHANNMVSVLYVSRVVSNSVIYGSLALVPVFMIGLYFSWLILLFGAQVAYAFQNRTIFAEQKQVENVNQRGREFIALRLMTMVGQRFLQGEPPCSVVEMAQQIGVPTRLVQQILQTLSAAHLAVETVGPDPAYLPARPIETITCHHVLEAMRAPKGQEMATREEPTQRQVFGEFERIQEAERKAASAVTMLTLVHRAQDQLEHEPVKSLKGHSSSHSSA